LALPGLVIENIETTRKTLPDFPGLWSATLR
jgi:3-phosphoshikimate 1-carboxyvinyltransferase